MYLDVFFLFLAVALLTIVIIFHELGHFFVGKICGIRVSVFSIGFGRPLLSTFDRNGTKWQLSWLLIGGYVKFSENSSELGGVAFEQASLMSRFLTVIAGPLTSLLLSFFIFIPIFITQGVNSDEPVIGTISPLPFEFPLSSGDRIISIEGNSVESFSDIFDIVDTKSDNLKIEVNREGKTVFFEVETFFPPLVDNVEILSPANRAGILPGDYITAVNGVKIFTFSELKERIQLSTQDKIQIEIIRNGNIYEFALEKRYLVSQNNSGQLEETLRIGISGRMILQPKKLNRSIAASFRDSFYTTKYLVELTLSGLKGMVTRDISFEQISGPVGITYAIGETSKFGIIPTLGLIGMISASLGILNLLPIPILDGGHLFSYLLEFILGRRIVDIIKKPLTILGLAIVATLFLLGFLNDINKIFS